MKPVADILALAAATLLLIAYRRRGNRVDLLAAVVCVALVALDLSRWPTVRADVGLSELALVAVVAVAYWNVVGFPRVFVRLFRVGYRSAEWDFDMRLYDEKARLDRLLLEYRSSDDWDVYRRWRTKVLTRGRPILGRMATTNAPSAEWAAVRDGYVQLYGEILDRIERDEVPDDARTLRRGTELKERADILRIAYRTSARRWMQGSDRK